MSLITDVVVFLPYDDRDKIKDAISTFEWPSGPGGLVRLATMGRLDTERAGGTKVFCSAVLAGAFNYLPIHEFKQYLSSLDWPENSVVIISGEESWDFDVMRFNESVDA